MPRFVRLILCVIAALVVSTALFAADTNVEYKVIATNKTSTCQKEMNEASAAGFRFGGVMGGETSFGGSEVVTIMHRSAGDRRTASLTS